MRRLLKVVLLLPLSLAVLLGVGLLALTFFINPNDFKAQIQDLARENANLALDIKGDIGWTFWPSLGVSVADIDARVGNDKELFASLGKANASVAVWPLFRGKVEMTGLAVDGLALHLVQGKDSASWAQIGPQETTDKTATPATAADTQKPEQPLDIPVTIPKVTLTHMEVRYDDQVANTQTVVSDITVEARDVNLKESTPFPLTVSLRYQDNDYRADLALDAKVALDLNAERYRLLPMTLDVVLAGATPQPVKLHLVQTLDADLKAGTVTLTDLALNAAGVDASGQFSLSGLNDEQLTFGGNLKVAPFNANQLLRTLGEAPIQTADVKALSRISADVTLSGPAGSLLADPLTLRLDDSSITGKAGLASLETGKIVYDLTLNHIKLDGYLPPAEEPAKAAAESGNGTASAGENAVSQTASTPLSDAPLLPLDTLRGLNVEGRFRIGEFSLANISGDTINTSLALADGKLAATAGGNLLAGKFSSAMKLDASGKTPAMSANGKVESLQIQPAVIYVLEQDLLKGVLTATFSGQAQGNSEQSLMHSATGQMDIALKDATVRGANLQSALVAGVNDLLGKYKELLTLLPELQTKPAILSEDTRIADLTATGALKQQLVTLSQVKAALDRGSLSGNGWYNMNNDDFEFLLGMQSPNFSQSPYLKDTTWPIRCAGNLEGDPKRWCGPDRKGLDSIAKQVMTKATAKKLSDKLGIEARGDTTQEVLKNAAKDEAKKGLQQQLDKLLNKKK